MIAILIKALMSLGTRLLVSLASEQLIEWAFFKICDSVVKSTKTPHDDEWFLKIKETYEASKVSEDKK
ncbi:hypothetical protein [Shewanella frigidimarina]|uniref:hypothetical protein n=1 Tax=Shewanella frigidimarina TaxID=56812 RepID=UPI003D7A98E4